MPKPKPTQVIRHEIVLGRSEKEMIEGVIGAYQFNRVSTPVVAALSDVSFLIFLGSVLAAWKVIDEETWEALAGEGAATLATAGDAWSWLVASGKAAKAKVDAGVEIGEDVWDITTAPLRFLVPGGEDDDLADLLGWLLGGRKNLRDVVP